MPSKERDSVGANKEDGKPAFHLLESESMVAALGTAAESEFDDLAEVAAAICSAPIGLVTLLDETDQYHKGAVGCSLRSVPRSQAFCAHTLLQDGLFTVRDAKADARFRTNPLVTGELGIRFYAGVPVFAPSGTKAGAICVLDTVRRDLKPWQARSLAVLAQQVTACMELRVRRKEAGLALESASADGSLFAQFAHGLSAPCYLKDKEHRIAFYNRALASRFEIGEREWIGKMSFDLLSPATAARLQASEESVFRTGMGRDFTLLLDEPGRPAATPWLLQQRLCRLPGNEPVLAVVALEGLRAQG